MKNVAYKRMANGQSVQLRNYDTRIEAEVLVIFNAMPTVSDENALRAVLPKLVPGFVWEVRKGQIHNCYGPGGSTAFSLGAVTKKA